MITEPAEGEFKAFSAACAHQGCLVSSVSDGTIDCSCHGSKFSIEDGSVVQGPAPPPSRRRNSRVSGGEISLAWIGAADRDRDRAEVAPVVDIQGLWRSR